MDTETRLDPTSSARAGDLSNFIQAQMARNIYPTLGTESYSTPFYVVGPEVDRVPVTLDTGSWGANLQAVLSAGVPIPPGARQAPGTDGHMTVYQPSTDTLWEFWRAVEKPDGWHAAWGGAMRNVSSSPGYYEPGAWPTVPPSDGWNWGATATSLPVIAGTATIAELRQGVVDHAVAASVPSPCRGYHSWPAQRNDGTSDSANCVPQGAHLRIDPALDLDSIQMPRVTRILATAAQRYGIVVRDRTTPNGSISLYAEQTPPGQPSAYSGPGGLFEGQPAWSILRRFPWEHLQLLPMSTCSTKGPCVQAG